MQYLLCNLFEMAINITEKEKEFEYPRIDETLSIRCCLYLSIYSF